MTPVETRGLSATRLAPAVVSLRPGRTAASGLSAGERSLLEAWDAFLAETAGGDLVQSSLWAEVKCRLGMSADIVVLRRAGRIVGGASLLVRSLLPHVRVGYVPHGPIADPTLPEALPVLLDALHDAVRASDLSYLIVQPPEHAEVLAGPLGARGFRPGSPAVAPEATVRVDLRADEEELLSRMRRSKRKVLRAAPRRGGRVLEGGRDDIERFWRLHAAIAARRGFRPLALSNLQAQWDVLAQAGALELLLCEVDGDIVAGSWLTAFGDTLTVKLNGWSGGGTAAAPNEVLDWAAMRRGKARALRWYDFGGLERPVAEGIVVHGRPASAFQSFAGFYKLGFGGEIVLLPRAMHASPRLGPRAVSAVQLLARSRLAQRALAALRGRSRARGGRPPA
jgi:lipid II:glycine glycyltransferase (peptidoglycan interpeptide bridge formation enzyme)